jgi:hypothetical protein
LSVSTSRQLLYLASSGEIPEFDFAQPVVKGKINIAKKSITLVCMKRIIQLESIFPAFMNIFISHD